MKCYSCKREIEPSDMVMLHGKPFDICLACNRAKVRAWKKKNPSKVVKITGAYEKRNKHKRKAYYFLKKAIKAGVVCRQLVCEECGDGGIIHAHHDDYMLPMEVKYLCPRCHSKKHSTRGIQSCQ